MWKVSVPMRFPLTKMPKLPASTTCALDAPLDDFFWSPPRGGIAVALMQIVTTTIAAKNLANFGIVTASPPVVLLRTTIPGSHRLLLPLACPWSQSETAPLRKPLCGLQRARRVSLRPVPAVLQFHLR